MSKIAFGIGIYLVILMLMIGIIFCGICIIVKLIKKKKVKTFIIVTCIDFALLIAIHLFISSHSTYYKYNDWFILGNNIHTIETIYGEFDIVLYDGGVGYSIYFENGVVHYYYILYDESGVIYHVYDGRQPDG